MRADVRGQVYRRGKARWLLLFTTWWLVVFLTLGGIRANAPAAVLASLITVEVAVLVLAIAAYRSVVIVDSSVILVRDMFRTTRFRLSDVARIEVGLQGAIAGPIASIRLRDGRLIRTPLWSGGLGAGNRATERMIRSFRADVDTRIAAETELSTTP